MGNRCMKAKVINPGSVLDRVISQSSNDDDCLLYKLANYKKTGELVDAYTVGGTLEVEKLIREQFSILMYRDGKGQIVSRTEYLRWKFRNTKHVVIPVEPTSIFDPLGKWEDHEACWRMEYRGSLGETLLHLLIICDTRMHTKLARILLKCYPKLAVDVVEGEEYLGASALHLAIAYNNNELVHILVDCGALIEQRAIGSFFLPKDQQRIPPCKSTDYEGLAYLGEYPLAWAACVNNETIYNLLLDNDADPDSQDSFGNTILHMVVVTDQLGMYGYALRHPKKCASNDTINDQGLTPLTLACRLGRASVFREMLEQSCKEFWRYSNITCSAYPLNALDTILPDGKTNWNSALFMILAGSKEEHLDMIDGGIIQRLLEEKWKTFAQRQFLKRITIAFIHLIAMSIAVYLRPRDRSRKLTEWVDTQDLVRMIFECGTVCGCLSFVIVQQGEEIKNQGFISFIKQLPHAPPKALFVVANFLILSCIPFRLQGDVETEESLLAFTMVFSWFFMMFFAGAIKLTGPFVTMVYSMITGDMLTFSIIYGIFLLAFSQSFYYLYKGHPEHNTTIFNEFDATWMAMYKMTLGSYDYSDLGQLAYPNAAKAVFIIFMIMVPILLLNMLIAMMGNTYAQVIERSEKEWVKQWAKIVVTLERAVSQEDAKQYIQEYSIKLSGTDLTNEVRGVMVIKSKSKTRAKQRKGAVANWKRVGKVTTTALKRRKMTGAQMHQVMWGHRTSICTPQKKKAAAAAAAAAAAGQLQLTEADALRKDGAGLDTAITQLSFTNDLNLDVNAIPQKKELTALSSLKSPIVPVAGSSPNKPGSPPTKLLPSNVPEIPPNKLPPPPDYNTAMSTSAPTGTGSTVTTTESASLVEPLQTTTSKGMKARRRSAKIGLRPKIIIFSDKKDLIRVSLDSDDSDDDDDVCHANYSHRFHTRGKSSKRRSIAGDMNLSSSRESLAGDTEFDDSIVKPQQFTSPEKARKSKKVVVGTGGVVNPAYVVDAEDEKKAEKRKDSPPNVNVPGTKGVVVVDPLEMSKSRPKSAKPKGGKSGKKVSVDVESPERHVILEDEAEAAPATIRHEKEKKTSRPKSAKAPSNGEGDGAGKAAGSSKKSKVVEQGQDGEKKARPLTALDKWTDKEQVQNMNKLVAWDRPEDDI